MAQHIRFTKLGEPANVPSPVGCAGGSIVALNADGTGRAANAPTDTYFGFAERDVAPGEMLPPIYNCEVPVRAVGAIPANTRITMATGGGVQVADTGEPVIGVSREAIADGARGRAYLGNPV